MSRSVREKAQQMRILGGCYWKHMVTNKRKGLQEEMPCDLDPKKVRGEPTYGPGEVDLQQRSSRTKPLRQTMPWMTEESGPVYMEGNKRQGPHTQQQHKGIKNQLTLEIVSEKTVHFRRNLQ